MYRTPQEEDEQSDNLSLPSRRHSRRGSAERPVYRPTPYYDDEHPEVPLFRRATRYLEQDEPEETRVSLSNTRRRRQRPSAPPVVKLARPSAYQTYQELDVQ